MTLIACMEAVALVAAVFLFLRHVGSLERAWVEERRELLNRIQRPEVVPLTQAGDYVIPEQEPDEINLVGHIDYHDDSDDG